MKITKNSEKDIKLENSNRELLLEKIGRGSYALKISSNDTNEKDIFTIPFCSLMDISELKIHEIFEEFLMSMFGNTILHDDYKVSKTLIDIKNKTIIILSDYNNAVLRISYSKEEIKLEIIKTSENNLNRTIYLNNEGNLSGGYIKMFRDLFDKLNTLALEPNKPQERILRNKNESV